VLDDDGVGAEVIRIRQSPFVFGRRQGDFLLPLDAMLSASHSEFVIRNGELHVRDLGSSGGTFLRLRAGRHIPVCDGDEFILGGSRFRFRLDGIVPAASPETAPVADSPDGMERTLGWHEAAAQGDGGYACLDHLAGQDKAAHSYRLVRDSETVGRDDDCPVALPRDDLLSPRHARFFRDSQGWQVADLSSTNGVWRRLREETRLESGDEIRLGEQIIRVGGHQR
jgi:pSer/pThr/pTyr-binding forkhead associated (FHA) protein